MILQQQSEFITRPEEIFASSSKNVFQENCMKNSFLLQPYVYEKEARHNISHLLMNVRHGRMAGTSPDKDWRQLGIYPPLFDLIGYFKF